MEPPVCLRLNCLSCDSDWLTLIKTRRLVGLAANPTGIEKTRTEKNLVGVNELFSLSLSLSLSLSFPSSN